MLSTSRFAVIGSQTVSAAKLRTRRTTKFLGLFRPSYRLAIDSDGPEREIFKGGALGLVVHLVPRAACTFTRAKLVGESRAALKAFELRVRHAQPFENADLRLVKEAKGDHAVAWSWRSVGNWRAREGEKFRFVLPESLAREGMENGVRLVRCSVGLEGEVWRDGRLTASRWWRAKPSPEDWRIFLRASQVDPDSASDVPPVADEPRWRDLPPKAVVSRETFGVLASPAKLGAAIALAFAAFAAFFASQFAVAKFQSARLQAALETTLQANADQIQARVDAIDALESVRSLARAGKSWTALEALAAVGKVMPAGTATLTSFRMNGGEVEINLETNAPANGAELVAALEQAPVFNNVFVQIPNDSSVVISARLAQAYGVEPGAESP